MDEMKAQVSPVHAQTILQVVIAALILWVGATVTETSRDIAVIGVQVERINGDINKLDGRVTTLEGEQRKK